MVAAWRAWTSGIALALLTVAVAARATHASWIDRGVLNAGGYEVTLFALLTVPPLAYLSAVWMDGIRKINELLGANIVGRSFLLLIYLFGILGIVELLVNQLLHIPFSPATWILHFFQAPAEGAVP